jgi:phosphatidylserine/phosphatidylglycerophosphate/cardiolipin synthase-like enzyme
MPDSANAALDRHHDFHGPAILKPGRNCGGILHCDASVLVDGAAYFAALRDALFSARRSIMIVGWDFDGGIPLTPGKDSPSLGQILRDLAERRPELEVRILVWGLAVIYGPSAKLPLILGSEWHHHPRIQLRLDRNHRFYASHHQKIVVIDDRLGFTGGIDLTVGRWDRPQHPAHDPARVTPDGRPYPPVHDLQIAVTGEAARSLGTIARERWRSATGEAVAPADADATTPDFMARPDFAGARIGIALTRPSLKRSVRRRQCARLTLDALSAARRSIYIESQYFTDRRAGRIIASHLARADGPEVVLLVTCVSHGFVEQWVMGKNRDRLLRRLKAQDRFDRLRVFYCVTPDGDGFKEVLIHSKLIIVDNGFLRIGSSNLNNRSIGLDSECDLAIEARSRADSLAIAGLRHRLLAEHLGETEASVREAMARHRSMVRAVDALNRNPRGLRPLPALGQGGSTAPMALTGVLDPKEPFSLRKWLRRRIAGFFRRTGSGHGRFPAA